jgi:RNA polymerase primary sigma factor
MFAESFIDSDSPHQICAAVVGKVLDRTPDRKGKPSLRGRELGPLEVYFREINATSLLTAEGEKQLAYRIADGDCEARDHLVRANLRLVVNLARAYAGRGLPLQDLIAEGNLGLIRAAEGFDPDMNTRFSTYASYWIKQSIMRMLVNTSKTIRVPAYIGLLMTKWNRTRTHLQKELGRSPTQEEIAQSLNVSPKVLKIIDRAFQIKGSTFYTDSPENGLVIDDMCVDETATSPLTLLSHNDEIQHALCELDKMEERQATVLRLRFGLNGEDSRTLKEIGLILGLTRERVRQIEVEGLANLKERMEAA